MEGARLVIAVDSCSQGEFFSGNTPERRATVARFRNEDFSQSEEGSLISRLPSHALWHGACQFVLLIVLHAKKLSHLVRVNAL